MNRSTLRFFLAICANADFQFILLYSHSRTSRTIRFFCKDLRETLKYVGKFSELKLNDEIQKEHTHASLSLSLSLYLPIRRCTLIFPKGCACTRFSIYNCKNGLDPDQTRMELRKERFANLKKLCILLKVRKVPYKSRCAR